MGGAQRRCDGSLAALTRIPLGATLDIDKPPGQRRRDGGMRREFALPDDHPAVVMIEDVAARMEMAWTARFEPLYLAQWWRPRGYVNPIVEVDLIVGGHWRIGQRDPEGNEFAFYGVFEEVDEPSVAVQTFVSELFAHIPTRLTTEFSRTPEGTQIVTTHEFPDEMSRRGALRLGVLERMSESSDHFDILLAQLQQR